MGYFVIKNAAGDVIQGRATITKAEQSRTLLGDDVINIEIGADEPIIFNIGDYIDWCGHTYTLNTPATINKHNGHNFSYSLTFESEQYELMDCAWLLPTNTYGDSYTGNLKDFLDILLENAERTGKEWELGTYPSETDYKTLTYSQTNCLNVLQQLCGEYGQEFEIARRGNVRILNIAEKVGGSYTGVFKYGRTGGAYKIERRKTSQKNIVTKLFVFGSDKNLPSNYRENKLCLPGKNRNQSFISDANSVSLYGIKENAKQFSEVYPARYGTISHVIAQSVTAFVDNAMDFDLNERTADGSTKWLIADTAAKIEFTSGNLAGYAFDILSYNNTEKKFVIKSFTDANGLTFPNATSAAFQFKAGDMYFIKDIRVPDAYVTAAENKLLAEGQKYFDENCKPKVEYAIELSEFYFRNRYGTAGATAEIFKAGMNVLIYDEDLNINKTLRVSNFTRDLLNPYVFKITIAESVQITNSLQRVIGDLTVIKQVIKENDLTDTAKARRNWKTTQDVLNAVFDVEGYYYTDAIKPASIETMMLAVGARSQQFTLKNVEIETNYGGDENKIHSTAGTLEHYTIADPDIKTWNIQESTAQNLDKDKVYYVYAKCERNGSNGEIVFETTQKAVESDPTYYYFLCGTLTSVISDTDGGRPARNLALTYGSTNINGRFVNTGKIQSADGSTYFDLDNNEIGGKINFINGLISKEILVGATESTATAGIGGDELLIWAGLNDSGNKIFNLYQNGVLSMVDKSGNITFNIDPNSGWVNTRLLSARQMQSNTLTLTDTNAKLRVYEFGGIETQINKNGVIVDGVNLTKRQIRQLRYVDSDGDLHEVNIIRVGYVVTLSGHVTKKDFTETEREIFPIPLGYRPYDFAMLSSIHNTDIDDSRVAKLCSDGTIDLTNIGGEFTYISGTYITTDKYPE